MKYFKNLFKPITVGNFEIPNRIVHVPTDISSSNPDGSVSRNVIRYHEEIARGGTGFIITGASTPDRESGRPTVTCLSVDADYLIPGLAKLAESMHRQGAKCAVQIQHPGRQAAYPRKGLISCSDMVADIPASAGHEVVYSMAEAKGKDIRAMTIEEIFDLIEKFAEGAWRVQQAGFDAVGLHAAHGYLIAQFMSPLINKRNDRFGGSFENRMRFPLEIIKSIQYKCGKDFPILIRYSGEEWIPGSRNLEESIEVAKVMEDAGCAALDISAGTFEVGGPTMDPSYYDEGWNTYAAEAIKKEVSIPVITSHSLRNPEYCDKILAEGKADMVGLSRALIADPYWANKAKSGQVKEIRRCISCLIGCWKESLMIKQELKCSINPTIGHYDEFLDMKPAENPINVAVVGGGVAGLEAARIATLRGHKVTVFERGPELGGILLCCCMVPPKVKMKWYLFWIREQIKKLGVEVRLNTEASLKDLEDFDAVIFGTGSKKMVPDIPGIEKAIYFEDLLNCLDKNCEYYTDKKPKPVKAGQKILIWGDHYAACDTAETMAMRRKEVIIVTENKELGQDIEVIHKEVMLKRFAGGNGEGLEGRPIKIPVVIKTNTTVSGIEDGKVTLIDNNFNKEVIEVDDVILAKQEPDTELYEKAKEKGLNAVLIGDAKEIRNIRGAITEGAFAGLLVGEDVVMNANGELTKKIPMVEGFDYKSE
jgi:2,4-dienoyl-CoA reductase-like NADH-dependent reductase (Old Yellow Enzyme family)/thioredoxin reductase